MKRTLVFAVIGTSLLGSGVALAEKGDWMVRLRAINIAPDTSSSIAGLDVDSTVAPEVDISYFLSKNLAMELILTVPQKHDVTLAGATIGSFKHLPPTLTFQYHFVPDQKFRPYVGAGINYTRISGVNLAGGTLTLENDSWGPAIQVGFDYEVAKDRFINVDLKRIKISSDVITTATGAKAGDLDVDPWVFGVGYGWRF